MTPTQSPRSTFFATTQWTVVGQAACGGDPAAVDALDALFAIYWQPLYRYLRRLDRSAQDAEDLVQGFFAHLIEHDGLRLVDRGKGRFRAFLLGSLKHFVANQWQREHRQKRGGFATRLSIDWKSAETGLCMDPVDPHSPDVLYDRDWAMALLDKVLDDLARAERDIHFDHFKPFLSVGSAHLPYARIAAEFGMTEGAARVAVHRLRKRYRQRLRQEIARTVSRDQQVEDEMRSLFSALSG